MDYGQPQLGRVYGNIHTDQVGHAARPGEGLRYPGRHHLHLHVIDRLLATIRETNKAMARPDDVSFGPPTRLKSMTGT